MLNNLPSPFLALLVTIIAFLYASIGFGGATGYLAVMSQFSIAPNLMASTALILNIVVAGISFFTYTRAGHLRKDLFWPFVATDGLYRRIFQNPPGCVFHPAIRRADLCDVHHAVRPSQG